MEQAVQGHKGGSSKAHQPAETRNNLLSKSYAKVLLAIGEGEFAGVPTGQDIYLDGTPLISATGGENFGGVKWEYRSGRVDQTHIAGMPDVSAEFPLNFTLTDAVPYTRLITNSQLDAIRVTLSWPSLFEQKDNGDIVGYNILYQIDIATDGGGYVTQGTWDTSSGKTTVEYNRTHRFNLPKPGTSWTLRVRRLTFNQNNVKIQDTMQVKSVAEVIDARFRYPNTALLYVEFDAELFGGTSIPAISVKTKGRLIQVPTNYDPGTRIYSGVWNGTFKWAYTNNPAWVFYDLVINERFGLGSRIKASMVDKWTLYQVAQYCDVLVANGAGGVEPRYTCNIYIQSRKEAWQVLRDIVAIFNGMLYWSGTQMVASADMPVAVNTVRNFNRSNVIDGKFTYGSTSEKTIYTTALVSYDNPDNHYETAVEAVNDLALVQRYKTWAQAELSALGCTSRGQAQRKGKYTMLTNSLNRIVTFKLGLEGYLPRPGEVIGVADQILAGASLAGRISTATLNTVTLDRVSNAVAGDILYVNKADGTAAEGRTILSVNGKVITVTTNYSAIPTSELGWYVEKTTLKSQLYRITKITWNDDEGKYEVTGIQYEDSKYAAIDTGARLESRPITSIPAGGQDGPTNITLSTFTFIEQTMAVTTMSVKWTPAAGAMNYEAQWRKDGGDWINYGLTATSGFDVKGIYSGAYQVRVRAINAIGTKSVWVESANTPLTGKVGAPPTLVAFTTVSEIFGIRINWAFQSGASDGAYIQLQQAIDVNGANTTELSLVAYPAQTYLKSNMLGGVAQYFRGRLIDRTGNQSAWTPWTYGISEYGTTKILASIVGEIQKTHLGQVLLSELNQTQIDIDDLQDQITNFTDALVYDTDKTYVEGDLVRQGSRLYQATQNVPIHTPPPNTSYWMDIGQVIEDANGLAAQVQQNTASITTIDGKVTTQAGQITALTSRVGDAEDDISGQATLVNNLQTTVTAVDGKVTSMAKNVSTLAAQARGDDGTGDLTDALKMWQNTAAIQNERVARADRDGSFASDMTTVSASAVQAQGSANTAQNAANAAQNTANIATASVQTVSTALATTNGQIAASYSIKLAVNSGGKYYGAGMGIGIENTPAGMQSQVLFVADRFAILNNVNGVASSPFVVQGGQTIINNALIGTASITNAMIADAQITYSKIGAAQIGEAHIINGHIINAKIGDAAVDTLKIAGRAVTIPVAFYAGGASVGGINSARNWIDVAVIGYTSTGESALINITTQYCCNFAFPGGFWRLLYNGNVWLQGRMIGNTSSSSAYNGVPASSFSLSVYAGVGGYVTWQFQMSPDASLNAALYVDNRAMTITEVKR